MAPAAPVSRFPKISVLRSRIFGLDSGATLGLLGGLPRRWVQDVPTTGASKQIANADALIGASGPGNECRATVLEAPTGFIGLGADRPHVVPCEEESESVECRRDIEQRQIV